MKNSKREQILRTIEKKLKKEGAKKILVFGSFSRNEEIASSDIDILVEFKKTISLLELIGIEQELSETLGVKVDLLTKKSISPLILRKIEQDKRTLVL
ncbi:MAG: nucleotidyltransferase family protein [Acidobacteriota bacterium]